MPQRVQLSRAKGWRMPANTVKVDRSTPYGNPFVTGRDGTAAECVRMFRRLVCEHEIVRGLSGELQQNLYLVLVIGGQLDSLRGKNLACWCPLNAPCHADVLLEVANR